MVISSFILLSEYFSWNSPQRFKDSTFVLLFIPLIFSLFTVVIFYWKSIKILRAQFENEQKSTRVYVRNLRSYSIAQILTYGPMIFYLLSLGGFSDFGNRSHLIFSVVCGAIANVTGFVNVLIFACQGSAGYKEPFMDKLDLDLTQTEW